MKRIGRRSAFGLAVTCVLALYAISASSALASGTTAFTCSEGGGAKDFNDAHCDNQVKAGEGKFGHVSITPGVAKEITLTNEKTANKTTEAEPFRLVGTIAGILVEVECKVVSGTAQLVNTEESGAMHAGGPVTIQLTKCTVPKPSGCAVAEPITYNGKFKTYQKGEEMGVEFLPMILGGTFAEITISGCELKGNFVIKGSFQGTPGATSKGKGATLGLTEGMSNLTWGGSPYTVLGTFTWQLKGGNPIALTTT